MVVVNRCVVGAVGVSRYRSERSWSTGVARVQWPLVGIDQNGRGQQVWRGCSGC